MKVELVGTVTRDGVRLDGTLARSVSPHSGKLPVDLFICHHGVGNNFYHARLYGPVGDLLPAAGCDVLRVNNRGHDVIYSEQVTDSVTLQSTKGRLGSAFEILDDCRYDWSAWIDFASNAGYRRIALWGHSLGAVKTIYLLANAPDERVRCAIASSPPRFSHECMLKSAEGDEFRAVFERAKTLVGMGEPDTLMSVTVPTPNFFSAQTFLDKYGPDNRYDFFALLRRVRTPLLITLGGKERGGTFRELAEQGETLSRQTPAVSFEMVAGADHYYSGSTRELWAAARTWLTGLGQDTAASGNLVRG